MTVLEATQRILAGWLRREAEIEARLVAIRDEQLALVSLKRTVERQRVAAELAVSVARDSGGDGLPLRRVSGGADGGGGV